MTCAARSGGTFPYAVSTHRGGVQQPGRRTPSRRARRAAGPRT